MAVVADTRAAWQRKHAQRLAAYRADAVRAARARLRSRIFLLLAGRYASTDDAYVQADMVRSAPTSPAAWSRSMSTTTRRCAGHRCCSGSTTATTASRSSHAEAQLASARLQIDGLRAAYRQKLAELKQAQDTEAYQQREFDRQQQLLADACHLASELRRGAPRPRHRAPAGRRDRAADRQHAGRPRRQSRHRDRRPSAGAAGAGAARPGAARSVPYRRDRAGRGLSSPRSTSCRSANI